MLGCCGYNWYIQALHVWEQRLLIQISHLLAHFMRVHTFPPLVLRLRKGTESKTLLNFYTLGPKDLFFKVLKILYHSPIVFQVCNFLGGF